MLFYKKLFKNKISVAGAGGGGGSPEPSYLMPPDGAFTKVGFQLYEALDLICEGPILGLSDQKGKVLIDSLRAKKEFNSSSNEIGSSTEGIDKGVYFANKPLRDERNSPKLGKYDVSLQLGKEFQEAPVIGAFPQRIQNVSTPVKGPYDMTDNRPWLVTLSDTQEWNRYGCLGTVTVSGTSRLLISKSTTNTQQLIITVTNISDIFVDNTSCGNLTGAGLNPSFLIYPISEEGQDPGGSYSAWYGTTRTRTKGVYPNTKYVIWAQSPYGSYNERTLVGTFITGASVFGPAGQIHSQTYRT
jgi:hypothetical protein